VTSAGSNRVAFSVEDSFRTLPGTPTWIQPGHNITANDLTWNNGLQRARQPDDPRSDGSREGNAEGTFGITFELTDRNYEDLVFANSTTDGLADEATTAPTSTWYIEQELPTTTREVFLEGAGVDSWTINYMQDENVTVDLSLTYTQQYDAADADAPTAPADGAINQPAKDDIVPFHAFDFDFNATNITKLQSLSVDISSMLNLERGQSRFIQGMNIGSYEPSLTFEAIIDNQERQEAAYGSIGATKGSATTIAEQTGTVTLGSLGDYNLTRVQPNDYSWNQLVSQENTTDPVSTQFVDIAKV